MHGGRLDNGAAAAPPTSEIFGARVIFPMSPAPSPLRTNRRDDRQRASDKIRSTCASIASNALSSSSMPRLPISAHVAGENNAGIDELTALDARYYAHNRISYGAQRAHEWPPVQKIFEEARRTLK